MYIIYFQRFKTSRSLPMLTRRPVSLASIAHNSRQQEYDSPDDVKGDQESHTRDVPKKVAGGIMCNVKGCTRVFMDRLRLMAHQLENSHIGYECPLCESPGSTKGVVRRHINSVHSTQRFHCNMCGKTFTRTDSLRDHTVKIHHSGGDSSFTSL